MSWRVGPWCCALAIACGPETSADDASDDTGTPPGDGAARVIYFSTHQSDKRAQELYLVDCSGLAPGPVTRLHGPLAPGATVDYSPVLSPMRRWLSYTVSTPMVGRELWFLRLDGPEIGAPVRARLPPQTDFLAPVYSKDEQLVAILPSDDGAQEALYLCRLADDGDCAAMLWSPPLAPGEIVRTSFVSFSVDNRKLAYTGDLAGDGFQQIFLAHTEPGDAGKFVQLSDAPMGAGGGYFTAGGDTLYFSARNPDPMVGGTEVFAVDLTVDPPGQPVLVSPPLIGLEEIRYRFRDDRSAMLMWSSSSSSAEYGDLALVELYGTVGGPPLPLHSAPGRVRLEEMAWAPGGRFVVYLAEKLDEPGEDDLYAVDVSGPVPLPPVRLNAPLGAGEVVAGTLFGLDASRLFYRASVGKLGHDADLWMAGVEPFAPAVKLNAPNPRSGYLPLSPAIASDLSRIVYFSQEGGKPLADLFLVELAGPAPPVKLEMPVQGPIDYGFQLSADGRRLFFSIDEGDRSRMYQLDVTPSPGPAIPISDEAHNVEQIYVLPAGD